MVGPRPALLLRGSRDPQISANLAVAPRRRSTTSQRARLSLQMASQQDSVRK